MIIEHKNRNFKYYIDLNSYSYLQVWAERNNPLVEGLLFENQLFSDKCEINLQTDQKEIRDICYFTATTNHIKGTMRISLLDKDKKEHFAKNFKFKISQDLNEKDNFVGGWVITGNSDIPQEHLNMIRLYCSAFIHINAFMFYGNITDDNHLKAIKQNDHIFFKIYDDKLYAIPTDKNSIHKSPEGIFSVRGHFRKYKSGKVVWISEYLKGLNK